MRSILNWVALAASLRVVNGDDCSNGAVDIYGNYYCQAVQAIHYSNVGTPGSYQRVTDMSSGSCASEPNSFGGPISPLDEEVSIHFRGPIAVKQFAAYSISDSATPPASQPSSSAVIEAPMKRLRGHSHQQYHDRRANPENPVMVTATIDGKVVSWVNNVGASQEKPAMVTATIDGKVVSWVNNWFGPPAATPVPVSTPVTTPATTPLTTPVTTPVTTPLTTPIAASVSSPASSPIESGGTATNGDEPFNATTFANGTYIRIGYYDSATSTSENLTFIGNYGGGGSGVFDEAFGASAAYLNSAGTGAASSSEILTDTTIPSDKEFAIFTNNPCVEGDSCGYVRPGSVAYHGFGGADKIFLLEFQMPLDGTKGFNADMPALWMLNAQIPRTLQYGQSDCSCWETNCGEFDIMETLASGSTYCKSTLHTNTPAGDSDYIERPTVSPLKIAVLFHSPSSGIRIQVLPDDYVFGTSLDETAITDIMSMTSGSKLSEFAVAAR